MESGIIWSLENTRIVRNSSCQIHSQYRVCPLSAIMTAFTRLGMLSIAWTAFRFSLRIAAICANFLRHCEVLVYFSAKYVPHVLDGIEVRPAGRPGDRSDAVRRLELRHDPGPVAGRIFVLKSSIAIRLSEMLCRPWNERSFKSWVYEWPVTKPRRITSSDLTNDRLRDAVFFAPLVLNDPRADT